MASGTISVKVEGESRVEIGAGGFAFGPRGIPHGFRIESEEPARILLMTGGPGFAAFIAEASDEVDTARLPEGAPADPARLKAAAARHEIDILGPPGLAGA